MGAARTERPPSKRPASKRHRSERAGRLAEAATVAMYLCLGFRPLARRFRTPRGEIDLVARRGGLVVFVEVKLRATQAAAAEALTPRGRRRIVDAAQWWLAKHPAHARYTLRFDVVTWAPRSWPRRVTAAFGSE